MTPEGVAPSRAGGLAPLVILSVAVLGAGLFSGRWMASRNAATVGDPNAESMLATLAADAAATESVPISVSAQVNPGGVPQVSGGGDTSGLSVGIVNPQFATLSEPAPDFSLPGPGGDQVTLESFKGRPVLMNFFATWCGPCRVEMPYLESVYKKHSAEGLVVLGIDVQEPVSLVGPFVQQLGLTFPIGVDTPGQVQAIYQIGTLPTTYFIDSAGEIATLRKGMFSSEADVEQMLRTILPAEAEATIAP